MTIAAEDLKWVFGDQQLVTSGIPAAIPNGGIVKANQNASLIWRNTQDAKLGSAVFNGNFTTMPTEGSLLLVAHLKEIQGANDTPIPDSSYKEIEVGKLPIDFGAGNGVNFNSVLAGFDMPANGTNQYIEWYIRNSFTSQTVSAAWKLWITLIAKGKTVSVGGGGGGPGDPEPSDPPLGLVAPHIPRQGSNQLANPNVDGAAGYSLSSQAVYVPGISRTADGSGCFNLPTDLDQVFTSPIIPTAGITYMCSVYMMSEEWPPAVIKVTVQTFRNGAWSQRDGALHSVDDNNVWRECGFAYTATASDEQLRFFVVRRDSPAPFPSNCYVDDFYLGIGIGFEQPKSAKVAFDHPGADTKVDALGNYYLWNGTSYDPWFPRMIAAHQSGTGNRTDYTPLANQGFNCVSWVFSKNQAVKATNAGMKFMMGLSPYLADGVFATGQFHSLANHVGDIKAAGLWDSMVGWYWDFENSTDPDSWQRNLDFQPFILAQDDDGTGKRAHPIWVLIGQYGTHRMMKNGNADVADTGGTYLGGDTGGQGVAGVLDWQVMTNLEKTTHPFSIAQINLGVGIDFRHRLYQALMLGAKGLSFWRDWFDRPGKAKLVDQAWWPDLPFLATETDALLPLIQNPHWVNWTYTTNNDDNVSTGPRHHQAKPATQRAHLMLSNRTSVSQDITVTVAGLTYTPATVHDYFTDAQITTISSGVFTLTIPGRGVNAGTKVVYLKA